MDEREYAAMMMSRLVGGDVMDLLRIEAQDQLFGWVNSRRLEDTGESFLVLLRLSEGRKHDAALFCLCRVDMSGDEARIRCEKAIPGLAGAPPAAVAGLGRFEAALWDLETEVVP
jgi:hypothetical protein